MLYIFRDLVLTIFIAHICFEIFINDIFSQTEEKKPEPKKEPEKPAVKGLQLLNNYL